MAAAGEILRPNLPGKVDVSGEASSELHVLAVDDSFVDRKVIERLLKISSCKGTFACLIYLFIFYLIFFYEVFWVFLKCVFIN